MILSCKKILQSHPAYKNNQDRDKLESSSLYTAFYNTSKVDDKFSPKIKLNATCTRFEKSKFYFSIWVSLKVNVNMKHLIILIPGLESGRNSDLEVEKNDLVHSPAFDACTTGALFLNISHITARIDKK